MLSFISRHPISVILALILHICIAVLITYEWHDSTESSNTAVQGEEESAAHEQRQNNKIVKIEPLKTFAVDSALVKQQIERIKAVESAKKREHEQLAAKTDKERQHLKQLQLRQKDEQAKADQATKRTAEQMLKTEAERKKTEEAKRLANLEKKKADSERAKAQKAKKASLLAEKERQLANEKTALAQKQRQVEEEKKQALILEIARKDKENKALAIEAEKAKVIQAQASAAAELQRQLDQESAAQRATQKRQQLLSLRQTYISSISAKVKDNWRTPARISPEAQCDLRITQTPTGSVTSVRIVNCNSHASKQFKDAAEKAVYRSEPLPAPPVKELFERVITFEFKP